MWCNPHLPVATRAKRRQIGPKRAPSHGHQSARKRRDGAEMYRNLHIPAAARANKCEMDRTVHLAMATRVPGNVEMAQNQKWAETRPWPPERPEMQKLC